MLKKISEISKEVKLCVAWKLFTTNYITTMEKGHRRFWSEEIQLLESISDQVPALYKSVLWDYTKFSRYAIRRALTTLQNSIKEYILN